MSKLSISGILLMLMMVSCTTVQETRKTYILPTPEVSSTVVDHGNKSVFFDRIDIADFLSKQGLVIEEDKNRIVIARNHCWGESPDEGIKRYLSRRFADYSKVFRLSESRTVGARLNDFQLNIKFDHFHSIKFLKSKISGKWTLIKIETGEILYEQFFDYSSLNPGRDYEGIIAGLAESLDQLAVEISTVLNEE